MSYRVPLPPCRELFRIFLALGVLLAIFGDLEFWIEFVIMVVAVFPLRPVGRRLGIALSA